MLFINVDEEIERLDSFISRLLGECMDCKTPCMKAHPSHSVKCLCCLWKES